MRRTLRQKTISECKPKYILETFFAGEKSCLMALSVVGNDNFLLDSGAFSYMNGAKATIQQMDEYVNKYINFIVKNGIKHFFEIDVDSIFGIEQVEYWRRRIENAAGRQCIPVWHKNRGVEYWKKMCDGYNYVAIGGLVTHEIKSSEFRLLRKMIDYAYKKNVKVHGLGFTKTKELNKYNFYSVDSSSFNTAATRGQQIHLFDGEYIQARVIDSGNKRVKLGELVSHNMKEWVKYQKYMDMRRY